MKFPRLALPIVAALLGCAPEQPPTAPPPTAPPPTAPPAADDNRNAFEKIVNDPSIENRRWQLVEINGRPVASPPGSAGAYFELDGAQARVTGNASCNQFFGTYELMAGNRLRFAPNLGATMMACDALEQEREFLDMLPRVDNYTLGDGVLSLNRARMAPLARFRAADE